jgi:hypothetical protein
MNSSKRKVRDRRIKNKGEEGERTKKGRRGGNRGM